jgi:hypothetical protein
MFICDVTHTESKKLKFIYRYVGGNIEKAFKISCTGKSVDNCLIEDRKDLSIEQFEECVEKRKPIYCWHEFVTGNLREVEFERILLPVSRQGYKVDFIIGAYEFSKAWDDAYKYLR